MDVFLVGAFHLLVYDGGLLALDSSRGLHSLLVATLLLGLFEFLHPLVAYKVLVDLFVVEAFLDSTQQAVVELGDVPLLSYLELVARVICQGACYS